MLSAEECFRPRRLGLVAETQKLVAQFYQIKPADMLSTKRQRHIAHPRQVAMYIARELTTLSLATIGRLFGGRDHTTVIHALRAVEKRMADDVHEAADVEQLIERLLG